MFIFLQQNRPVLKNFLLTVILEGLEQKFNMLLSRGMYSDEYGYQSLHTPTNNRL